MTVAEKPVAPCLYEWSGALSATGSYALKLYTQGAVTPREMRNLIKQLDMVATWLEEDEVARPEKGTP